MNHADLTLGSVVLGSAMFARDTGLAQWNQALLGRQREPAQQLHCLTPAPGPAPPPN